MCEKLGTIHLQVEDLTNGYQKVAEENIVTYKVGYIKRRVRKPTIFKSCEYEYRYYQDKLNKTKLTYTLGYLKPDNTVDVYTSSGFYSFTNLKAAKARKGTSDKLVIVKCIIPKGSVYTCSSEDVIVSNQIIIKGTVSEGILRKLKSYV